jgi:hypothetical protein
MNYPRTYSRSQARSVQERAIFVRFYVATAQHDGQYLLSANAICLMVSSQPEKVDLRQRTPVGCTLCVCAECFMPLRIPICMDIDNVVIMQVLRVGCQSAQK